MKKSATYGIFLPMLLLTFFATDPSWNLGFAIPMTVGAMFGLVNFVLALLLGPETKDVEMVPDLVVA